MYICINLYLSIHLSIYLSFYLSISTGKIGHDQSTGTIGYYRGTSLMRNTPPVGPYSRPMPRDRW